MNKPAHPTGYADRHIDCQFAMEDHFLEMMEAAQAAGWTLEDAAMALTDLADNLVLKNRASDDLEDALARLKATREG